MKSTAKQDIIWDSEPQSFVSGAKLFPWLQTISEVYNSVKSIKYL